MIRSAFSYVYGLGFWGANGHDAIWHLALINQITKSLPPHNPVFAPQLLSHYHWGFDFLVASLNRLIHLPAINLYFHFLPPILGSLLGILSYQLALKLTKNKKIAFLFVFFNYFAGSFGWLITLIRQHQLGGESLFWSMQSVSFLINPPYALSLILLFLFLKLFFSLKKHNSSKKIFILLAISFLISFVKIYAGILLNLSLVTYFFIGYLQHQKINKNYFYLCLGSGLLSLAVLFLFGVLPSTGSSLIQFKPFWFVHSLIESTDKLYLPSLATWRYNLSTHLLSYKLFIFLALEIFLLVVFLIGNLSWRFLAIFYLIPKFLKKQLQKHDFFLIIFSFFSLAIPLIFVQSGTAWNTIQFFYYFLIISNFYLAKFMAQLPVSTSKLKKTLFFFIILTILPTSYATIKDYLGSPAPSSLPNYEIEALDFLKKQKKGIVLSYPYNQYSRPSNWQTPLPLYLYQTTAYISAFSHQTSFLADRMNLDITGADWASRLDQSRKFFTSSDKFMARGFLLNNHIDYIYLVNNQNFKLNPNQLEVKPIFNNDFVRIYKVMK